MTAPSVARCCPASSMAPMTIAGRPDWRLANSRQRLLAGGNVGRGRGGAGTGPPAALLADGVSSKNRRRRKPGASTEERVDRHRRIGEGAADRVGEGEQPAAGAAGQDVADQRDRADHAVDVIDRHDGAGQVDGLGLQVDDAVEALAEIAAGPPPLLLRYPALGRGVGEIRLEPVEGQPAGAEQILHAGGRGRRQQPRHARRVAQHEAASIQLAVDGAGDAVAIAGGQQAAAGDVVGDVEHLQRFAGILAAHGQDLAVRLPLLRRQPQVDRLAAWQPCRQRHILQVGGPADRPALHRAQRPLVAQHQLPDREAGVDLRAGRRVGRGGIAALAAALIENA